MKQLFIFVALIASIGSIWFFGIVFEFEYPYMFTLAKVRNSVSTSGIPVKKVITSDGQDWSAGLHWHTCSYCADSCGNYKNLISIQLPAPDKHTIYFFAYCRTTHTIVPMNDATAEHFLALMPTNDRLVGVTSMNGMTGSYGNGYGEFKLPSNWFRQVTAIN